MAQPIDPKRGIYDLEIDKFRHADGDTSDVGIRVFSAVTSRVITFADVIQMSRSLGLQSGESYDQVIYKFDGGVGFLRFVLNGIEQFDIIVDYTDKDDWTIFKTVATGNLLQENGDNLLQENGDHILVEGLIPV